MHHLPLLLNNSMNPLARSITDLIKLDIWNINKFKRHIHFENMLSMCYDVVDMVLGKVQGA